MTDDVADRLVVTLELSGVADKAGFMERCVHALELPDWFGRNWDALADSLTDRSVWPADAAERGLLIVVTGWRTYAKARPEEWEIAQDVFAEAADRPAGLSVLLVLGPTRQKPSDDG